MGKFIIVKMNKVSLKIINLNMDKNKKEIFKKIIINFLVKQIEKDEQIPHL